MIRFILLLFISTLVFACGDPCDDVACGTNGSCDDGTCICDDWYEGANCETETRAKFLGSWNSTSACELGSTNSDPTWTIGTSTEASTFILQSTDVLNNTIITATLNSDNQATITPFSVGESDFTGTISYINETTMAMDLSLDSPAQAFTCNYTMSK